jgi:GTP cyclohydrolase IA
MSWEKTLELAIEEYVGEFCDPKSIHPDHLRDTPRRVVQAFSDYVSGYKEDPEAVLETTFEDKEGYDEMVHVVNIPIVSMCAHHLLPIIGKAHFAYIPKGRIVGLSKIPRFIDILSRRLQVQENLTRQIADTFYNYVEPHGCAVNVVAMHCCMVVRGIRQHDEITQTTALRGYFKDKPQARNEFLTSITGQLNGKIFG